MINKHCIYMAWNWRVTKNIWMVKTWWVLMKSCLWYEIQRVSEFVAYCMEFGEWPKMLHICYGLWNLEGENFLHMAWKLEGDKKVVRGINLVGVNTMLVWNLEGFGICCILYGIWRITKKATYGTNHPNSLNMPWNGCLNKNLANSLLLFSNYIDSIQLL